MKTFLYITALLLVVGCTKAPLTCEDPTTGTVQFIAKDIEYNKIEIRYGSDIVYWNVTSKWFWADVSTPAGTQRVRIWVYTDSGIATYDKYVVVNSCMTTYIRLNEVL